MESKCFNHALDERLIDLVRTHPALYQSSHISYKENAVKENVWDEIALSLDRTGNAVSIVFNLLVTQQNGMVTYIIIRNVF